MAGSSLLPSGVTPWRLQRGLWMAGGPNPASYGLWQTLLWIRGSGFEGPIWRVMHCKSMQRAGLGAVYPCCWLARVPPPGLGCVQTRMSQTLTSWWDTLPIMLAPWNPPPTQDHRLCALTPPWTAPTSRCLLSSLLDLPQLFGSFLLSSRLSGWLQVWGRFTNTQVLCWALTGPPIHGSRPGRGAVRSRLTSRPHHLPRAGPSRAPHLPSLPLPERGTSHSDPGLSLSPGRA